DLDLSRRDHLEERLSDGAVDVLDGQALADGLAVALMARVADVRRAGGPVVQPHPTATPATDHQPLEHATAPPRRTPAGLELRAVVLERRPDGEMAVPGDVGRMVIAQQHVDRIQGEAPTWPCAAQPA